MFNTIILYHGFAKLTRMEYKRFEKGDTLYGDGSCPDEIKRWDIKDEALAKAELAKYHCVYRDDYPLWYIDEYALEYCECDEDGEFVSGFDCEFAKELNSEV